MGEVQGGWSVCAGCQEHVLLLIMWKGLRRRHLKLLSKVIRLLISVLHKRYSRVSTLSFILQHRSSRKSQRFLSYRMKYRNKVGFFFPGHTWKYQNKPENETVLFLTLSLE